MSSNTDGLTKVDNYSEPRREEKKIWNLSQVVVAPVVIGPLEVTPRSKKIENWLNMLDLKSSIELLQKAELLGTAKNCKASPRNLTLLGATCCLGNNLPELPTKPR